ncbi:T9SS C-terminal target domain-containing protein [Pseudopedobacter sp.]|uniref:T9SS C-terminal target domain-containing protein n=1 Tax=Pseudopedobacter sp. TaxID=1936787 RepID=UPI00333F7D9C
MFEQLQSYIYQKANSLLRTGLFGLLVIPVSVLAQHPVIKVDLNQTGRREAEVNELDYIPFPYLSKGQENITEKGVTITFKAGNADEELSTDYYKVGIQSPHYARLSSDGLQSKKGVIVMYIKGLPTGRHTLLTYHNHISGVTFYSPIDISVNGKLKVEHLIPSQRVLNNIEAKTAYIQFDAVKGKDVIVLFKATEKSTTANTDIIINGFEINTSNAANRARLPFPKHGDEHVNADNGKLMLSWKSAKNATSHDVYIGNNADDVARADRKSSLFKGNQKYLDYEVKDQYSMLTYYWRIDEVAAEGKITKGTVWRYRPRQLAFIDAEGYGRFARGGRGGKVVEVTNLNDDGPGSFREAVSNDIGPRTIVFNVSGIIELKSRLILNQNNVTVAGQTAPGKGITIRSAPFGIGGNDVIVRFMRVRLGAGKTFDGMGITGANHSIIDHSSISWTIDEAFSSRGAKNITLQRTLISEALNVAGHKNYPKGKGHGYAATIGGDTASYHHNLLAHCYGRNWSLGGGLNGDGAYTGKIDIRNNVVYNWGIRTTDGGANEVNFVNNYYKPGEASKIFVALNAQHEGIGKGMQRYYFAGNVMPGYFDENNQEKGKKISGRVDFETFVSKPFFEAHVNTQPAGLAYKMVLSDVGCNQPVFDDHDIRIIHETLTGTYKYKGSVSGIPGHPDSQEDVGGWENYPELKRSENWDSDHDGLPDWWERIYGTNVNSQAGDFSDSNADPDRDGFTNLDDYLEWMAKPHFIAESGKSVTINLSELSRGFTEGVSFNISNIVNGKAILKDNQVVFTPNTRGGLCFFDFKVTDKDGQSMSRKVNILNAL